MNTESVSCGVLGLGANALRTFEFGRDPLGSDSERSQFFLRPHNVLSAVEGLSSPGYLSRGSLGLNQSDGSQFMIEMFARSGSLTITSPDQQLLRISVIDQSSSVIVAEKSVTTKDFELNNTWTALTVSFST